MSVAVYAGYLDYVDNSFEDVDEIEVHELILRGDELSFDLTTTWDEHGKWRRSGSAKKSPGSEVFESPFRPSKSVSGKEIGDPCSLIFKIKSVNTKTCEVAGAWIENGQQYQFKGKLERKRRQPR